MIIPSLPFGLGRFVLTLAVAKVLELRVLESSRQGVASYLVITRLEMFLQETQTRDKHDIYLASLLSSRERVNPPPSLVNDE